MAKNGKDHPDKASISSHVGERLRVARHVLGLTLEDVAPTVGLLPQGLSRLERGQDPMTVAHYYLLCRQYDLPLDQPFTGMPAELGPAVVPARDDHGRPSPVRMAPRPASF